MGHFYKLEGDLVAANCRWHSPKRLESAGPKWKPSQVTWVLILQELAARRREWQPPPPKSIPQDGKGDNTGITENIAALSGTKDFFSILSVLHLFCSSNFQQTRAFFSKCEAWILRRIRQICIAGASKLPWLFHG